MAGVLDGVDMRTRLAGHNRLELLLFRLGDDWLALEAGLGDQHRVGSGKSLDAGVAADASKEADVGALHDQGGAPHRLAGEAVDDHTRHGPRALGGSRAETHHEQGQ